MGAAFQTVASDVDSKLSEYRTAMEQINSNSKIDASDSSALKDTTRALASFVDTQLPELQEKSALQRRIPTHPQGSNLHPNGAAPDDFNLRPLPCLSLLHPAMLKATAC